MRFYQHEPGKSGRQAMTGVHFTALRAEAASFEDVAALNTYSEIGLDLVSAGGAQRLRVLPVTAEYFRTLRAAPVLGRGFERGDEAGTRRVVLSDRIWRARFHADAGIVGSVIRLDADNYEVAGVARQGFSDPVIGEVDAWVPYRLSRDTYAENYSLSAIGRLRGGVSVREAQAELASLSPSFRARWPDAKQSDVAAVPLQDDLVTGLRGPLRLLLAAVGLVLLVACLNVANLALVRATGRAHEFAVRSALGSGRARLVRQLFVESLVLAACGGGLGLALASFGVTFLGDLGRGYLPRLNEIGLDPAVLLFAAVTTIATALVFGVAPALRLAQAAPQDALRQQSRSATGTRRQGRVRRGLAAAQLALALTLLAGAGVLIASFYRLQQVDLGIRVARVFTFDLSLPAARYSAERRAQFHEQLADSLASLPGVTAAGGISRLPATGSFHPWNTHIRSGPRAGTAAGQGNGFPMQQRVVSGGGLAALGIPLLAGRGFDDRDAAGAPRRAIVSAAFARQAFPGTTLDGALGQRIASGGAEMEIVGVVGDVALDVYGAPSMAVYRAHRQFADNRNWALTQVVASDRSIEETSAAVRAAVARLDPELVVHRAAALSDVIGRGANRERFALVLMVSFAGVSVALAALGLYGVLAYNVRQRAREIAIRVALGATRAQVRRLVLRQATSMVAAGLALGAVGAFALGRWLSSLAFQVSASDPRIFAASAMLLTLVALGATWIPARRASRVEPRIGMLD